jgi:hypothetical protein
MTGTYLQNKKSIYNWVAKNPDRHREINRINQRRYDRWRAIQKVYLQILL